MYKKILEMPKQQYNFRYSDPNVIKKAKEVAKKEKRSVSTLIELAIEQYCKASGR